MKYIFILLLMPLHAYAGGDYWQNTLEHVEETSSVLVISMVLDNNRSGCNRIQIKLNYQRVPWYSWLPFVKSGHPSAEETDEAIRYLKSNIGKKITFGEMGRGLVMDGDSCHYVSKGLKLIKDEDLEFVMSYYHET